MAGRLQHNRLVKLVPLLVGSLVSGCIALDPINQRPSIEIIQTSSDVVHRGDHVTLDAASSDPEGQAVSYEWRVYACGQATQPGGCDDDTLAVPSFDDHIDFMVPKLRLDGSPLQSIRVVLDATDSLGAAAKPSQELLIAVANAPPELTHLRFVAPYHSASDPTQSVVGAPIQVYEEVTDPDDGPQGVHPLDWMVFSPASQPAYTLDDLPLPDTIAHPDPQHDQFAKLFTPMGEGMWSFQVTATDTLGAMAVESDMITIGPDSPPCLAQYAPITAPAGQALPMPDPTLFQVLVVTDDLDPYPTIADPIRQATTFTWSLKPPGGTTHQVLPGVTGASVALDPALYTPGDILELRVEVADRNHTPITCADASPTCSISTNQSCIQRLTWRVEVQ